MKQLNGSELAQFVKVRQARQVRALRQSKRIFPKLAIVATTLDPVIETYMRLKSRYGEDILIDVEIHRINQDDAGQVIKALNEDPNIHGIIVQLPLSNPDKTAQVLNLVAPEKDVDGLGEAAVLDPATPTAISWLLAGYGIDLGGKKIAIIGNGRLVGAPLARMWQNSGYDVTVFDESTEDVMKSSLKGFDVIVTAAGAPGLITSDLVKFGAVVVDAGTASEHGKIVGDVAEDVRARDDIAITPEKGGVGPLTITALFDNVIRAASERAAES